VFDFESLLKATASDLDINEFIKSNQICLVRHTMKHRIDGDWSNFDNVLKFDNDMLLVFTGKQSRDIFAGYKLIITFVATEGTGGMLRGAFRNNGIDGRAISKELFLKKHSSKYKEWEKYCKNNNIKETANIFYDLEKCNVLEEFKNRLIIDWGKGTQQWVQKKLKKEILEILPKGFVSKFPGWNQVLISHQELKEITSNQSGNRDWYQFLSEHDGVYVILDKKTNQKYVGSAYSAKENGGGIWGRWASYANTGHNNNKALKELDKLDPKNCENFMYSIHYVVPRSPTSRKDVLFHEQLLKRKIGGELNRN
jgi:hypothetical protein